jgi:hypothetical protein
VRPYVVATKTGPAALRAHALVDRDETPHRYGIALCGLSVEGLSVVPGLLWDGVEPENRCQHCARAAAAEQRCSDAVAFGPGRWPLPLTSEPRTGPERVLSMQERVNSSQDLLDRQAQAQAQSERALADSRGHLADMTRRALQDGTP